MARLYWRNCSWHWNNTLPGPCRQSTPGIYQTAEKKKKEKLNSINLIYKRLNLPKAKRNINPKGRARRMERRPNQASITNKICNQELTNVKQLLKNLRRFHFTR